ncbi:MAG: hypothetical protein Q9213_000872 [Squamulea squamosa]
MTDPPGDTRRTTLSPRPKGRGCAFNHDVVKATPRAAQAESVKKRFNVDSPTFTPASLAANGNQNKPKSTGISPKFANAAPFKPKGAGIGSRPASTAPSATPLAKGYNPNAPEWTALEAQEFLPSSYNNGATSPIDTMSSRDGEAIGSSCETPLDVPTDDPFVIIVNHAVSKYFGDAPLHVEPSPSVQLPSSPTSHQYPKPVKSFDRTKLLLASRSTLDASAAPFTPERLSPHLQSEAGNRRSTTYPLTKESLVGGSISNKDTEPYRKGSFQADQNGDTPSTIFDHYTPTPSHHGTSQAQINPYSQDGATMGTNTYFPGSNNYPQQLQHHLYAALPPHRELSQPNQRTARDFFIPENLRQTLARKSEASRMTIPNSTLPPTIAHYHSLVPLVNNSQKTNTLFGYQNHAYRAESNIDGRLYCLRRLQGYRVNEVASEHAIRNIQQNWKRVRNGSVVSVHLAFTNSSFGDSSLIVVTDFHPLSETLAQRHFTSSQRYANRYSTSHVPEETLWGYIVQIASGLKSIHSAGLAARVIDATKILLTDEGRIRLNACGILDVVQADAHQALADLQRLDLYLFGKVILALGSNNASQHNQAKAMETFSKCYSPHLRQVTSWLLGCISPQANDGIDNFLIQITSQMASTFDSALHQDDAIMSTLARELENSRMVRLNIKISMVLERPEYRDDPHWAAHGARECIRLFRDYVFHQVDAQGRPSIDLGHIIGCLNRLDVGSEEKVMLTSRDEETVIVVSYKEIKAALEGAYLDLYRRSRQPDYQQ